MILIRNMVSDDAAEVLQIYQDGIDTGNATFAEHAPDWAVFDAERLTTPRLVATQGGVILGWATLTGSSSRCVYHGVAEVSVYVAPKSSGTGIGAALLKSLVTKSELAGIWLLTAGIFPENIASLRLHDRFGFKTLGRRDRPAKQNYGPHKGWRDVIMMERRSKIAGTD